MGDRDTEKLIDALLDGELSADKAAEVRSRIERDPALRRGYGPMLSMLRSPEQVEVPAGLRDRIVAAVHERDRGEGRVIRPKEMVWRRTSNRLAWIGAMAASIALFMAGWFGARMWMTPATPTPAGDTAGPAPAQVVITPGMLAAYAQSMAARGSIYPVPNAVQGALIEMIAQGDLSAQATPVIHAGTDRAAAQSPAEQPRESPKDQHEPVIPVFPLIQRL
ncbi:MAG TPA: hypothetical protein VLM89_02560 [Phycisphaerae bacterium]|nr:hypothetical protein [Phycisphaerae bacterium]